MVLLSRLRKLAISVITIAVLCLTFPLAAQASEAFDAVAANRLYLDWYTRFENDFRGLVKEAREIDWKEKPPGDAFDLEDINKIFRDSVMPGSRMAVQLVNIANSPESYLGSSISDPPVAGWAIIVLRMFRNATPAGYGGLYDVTKQTMPSQQAKQYPGDKDSFVLYMNLHLDNSLSGVLNDPDNFTSYHLPPHGVLERNAYPFLNFLDKKGNLFITGMSAEFGRVSEAIYRMQLY